MVKTFRWMTVLMVVALLAVLVPASLAQDATFGLSDEDFAAFSQANAQSTAATSASFDWVLTGSTTGIPDGDLTINVNGTGFYGSGDGAPLFQLVVGGSLTAQGQELPVDLEIRLVNETLYFRGEMLTGGQWQGLPVDVAAQSMGTSLPFDPSSFGSSELGEAFAQLATLNPQQYIQITRDGSTFSTSLDIAGLIGSPEFQQFLIAAAQANPDSVGGMDEAQMQQAAGMVGVLFQNSNVSFNQTVGADGLISNAVLDLALNIDPAMVGEQGDPVALALNFNINLSGYNQPYTVEVPEGAMMMGETSGG